MLCPMSEKAAGAKREQGRAWQRNATRAKIISVARRMVERDGVELTSLNRVAEDAGFAPVTVYAYFPSINDLFVSILADDLAVMARSMRESFPFAQNPAAETVPAAEDEPAAETAELKSQPRGADVVSIAPVAAEHAPVAEMRKDRTSLGQRIRAALRKDQDEKAPPAQTPESAEAPRVDAWLERRLRVFERTLADLEARVAETERTSQRAAGLAQDGLSTLNRHFEDLRKRDGEKNDAHTQHIEDLEKRQRENFAELRTALKDTVGRLDALEARVLGDARPAVYLPPDDPASAPPQAAEPQPETASAETDRPDTRQEPRPAAAEAGESFLSAARRAARAAATLSQIEEKGTRRFGFGAIAGRTRMLLIAGAVLLAMSAGAAAVLHNLPAHPARLEFAAISPAQAAIGSGTTRIHLSPAGARARIAVLASQGMVKAQLLMGLDSLNGEGTAKDDAIAAQWLARAAKSGDPIAEYWLGLLYETGRGVARDPASAVHLYEASATQGNRKAMHALAMAYATGQGAPKDFAAAARWFSQAADLGLVNSQFNLAVLYERGEGVPQSLLNAYKWYAIAAAQGDSESQARVDALATQLSADDLAAARQAVADFKPRTPDARANLAPRADMLPG